LSLPCLAPKSACLHRRRRPRRPHSSRPTPSPSVIYRAQRRSHRRRQCPCRPGCPSSSPAPPSFISALLSA
jgi:hypothetical protein